MSDKDAGGNSNTMLPGKNAAMTKTVLVHFVFLIVLPILAAFVARVTLDGGDAGFLLSATQIAGMIGDMIFGSQLLMALVYSGAVGALSFFMGKHQIWHVLAAWVLSYVLLAFLLSDRDVGWTFHVALALPVLAISALAAWLVSRRFWNKSP
jgi:hypothetical protein